MTTVRMTVQNGRLVSVDPVDWPEGTEYEFAVGDHGVADAEPSSSTGEAGREFVGDEQMTEENWPTTPAGIQRLVARIERLEPLTMTDEEIANWHAAMEEMKQYEIAHAEEEHRKLVEMWK